MGPRRQFSREFKLEAIKPVKSRGFASAGVISSERDPLLPAVKTIAEQGVAGFDTPSWFGIFAPEQTPQPIVDKLNGAIRKILARPETVRRFAELGVNEGSMTAAEFRSVVAADNAAIHALVQQVCTSVFDQIFLDRKTEAHIARGAMHTTLHRSQPHRSDR